MSWKSYWLSTLTCGRKGQNITKLVYTGSQCTDVKEQRCNPVLPFPSLSEHVPSSPQQGTEGRKSITIKFLYYFRILRFLINNSIVWLKDQQHHFLMHLNQTEWPVAVLPLLPLQEILIHIDGLKAGKVLSACRVGMGGWRWTNSYWHWLGTLITQNEKKICLYPKRKQQQDTPPEN